MQELEQYMLVATTSSTKLRISRLQMGIIKEYKSVITEHRIKVMRTANMKNDRHDEI